VLRRRRRRWLFYLRLENDRAQKRGGEGATAGHLSFFSDLAVAAAATAEDVIK
jgi:hypothetical protein